MKTLLILAAFYGLSAVILGAFGAHALKDRIPPERLISYETGVRYQLIHAAVLLLVVLLAGQGNAGLLKISCGLFGLGVLLFSFSLYLLALRDMIGLTSWRWLGPVTPLGGLCLIGGWAALLVWAVRAKL